jgi:hypothetical protein
VLSSPVLWYHLPIADVLIPGFPNCFLATAMATFDLQCTQLSPPLVTGYSLQLVHKRNKSTIHLHVIPIMKCGCMFWEFAKRKLATRKDKIRKK